MRTLALLLLAACSVPDKHPGMIDARAADAPRNDVMGDGSTGPFACRGQPFAMTAPQIVTLKGRVFDPIGTAIPTTTTLVIVDENTGMSQSVMLDASFNFNYQLQTNGRPFVGHFQVDAPTSTNFVQTLGYPSRPFDHDLAAAQLPFYTSNDLITLAQVGGAGWDATTATLGVVVSDCNDQPQAGAMMQKTSANAQVRYVTSSGPSAAATATDTTGAVLEFLAATGTVTVNATLSDGNAERPHTVNAPPGVFTGIIVQP
jgi:hypothetical protein